MRIETSVSAMPGPARFCEPRETAVLDAGLGFVELRGRRRKALVREVDTGREFAAGSWACSPCALAARRGLARAIDYGLRESYLAERGAKHA